MTHATLFPSPPQQTLPAPQPRAGTWLSFVLLIALFVVGVCAILASGVLNEALGLPRRAASDRTLAMPAGPASPLQLPGFQRRGNLLTGQVAIEDGRRLHLVIDARSNAIIGAKLVEAQAPAAR